MSVQKKFKAAIYAKKPLVKRKARGFIKHDYLVPGGPYEEQWDWDGFFVGMALASEDPSESVYLKNWATNYLEHVRSNGFTPGLLTPRGIDKRLKHVKPFLAQGAYFASKLLKDFSWISESLWRDLKKSIDYREGKYHDAKTGLVSWADSMESGADNNVAVYGYPEGDVLSVDLNVFLMREYQALTLIAKKLGKKSEQKYFQRKYTSQKQAILKYLWDDKDQILYNRQRVSGNFIKRVGYSSLVGLWGGILPLKKAKDMIRRYVTNPKKLWARFGVRTLALDDPDFNQKNIIKPHSNWQGPTWPLVNYLTAHALARYGYKKEALKLADRTATICLADIKKSGGMHENYNADTGKPLAAPNFISWNLLIGNLNHEIRTGKDPFWLV